MLRPFYSPLSTLWLYPKRLTLSFAQHVVATKSHEFRRSSSSVDALTRGSLKQSDPRISATEILITKPQHPKQTGYRCSLLTSRVLPKLVRANTETAFSSLDDLSCLLADRSILTVSGAQNSPIRTSWQRCGPSMSF